MLYWPHCKANNKYIPIEMNIKRSTPVLKFRYRIWITCCNCANNCLYIFKTNLTFTYAYKYSVYVFKTAPMCRLFPCVNYTCLDKKSNSRDQIYFGIYSQNLIILRQFHQLISNSYIITESKYSYLILTFYIEHYPQCATHTYVYIRHIINNRIK